MSTTGHKKTAVELENALALLDEKLERLGVQQPIEIKAIGGFALLKHGIREEERAYTVDIDTVTRDYAAQVVAAIEEVATETQLDSDWLNNYNVMDNDPEHVESMLDAKWLPQDLGLRNIDVSIASIETLTRSKIIASDNAEFSERLQDVPDLLDLLEHQEISDVATFTAKYPDPFEEYPETRRFVEEYFNRQSTTEQERAAKLKARFAKFPELRDAKPDQRSLGHDDEPGYSRF